MFTLRKLSKEERMVDDELDKEHFYLDGAFKIGKSKLIFTMHLDPIFGDLVLESIGPQKFNRIIFKANEYELFEFLKKIKA